MTQDDTRTRLLAMQEQLDAEDLLGEDDQETVKLDQASVGRLSRMDALQRQAMAKAAQRRREALRIRISSALQRLNDGEYGYCTECGEDIAPARLSHDPSLPTCVSCARG